MSRAQRNINQTLTLLLIGLMSSATIAQDLVNWDRDQGELGLGYPVPIPVDTADAFDGFRSYDGLHMKHQTLMAGSENIQGMMVGQTRQGRDIWAYVFSDGDDIDTKGNPEYSIMIQGGIHAREWQSPEVTTAVMEYLAANQGDGYWVDYLTDNGRFVILPVLNIDGFLQTQRYPIGNYLRSGQSPNAPRDGRMRRKNMLGVDEILTTTGDHLLGVDLNRNNLPGFGSGNPFNRPFPPNSSDQTSLVYHGASAASEPEIQAMQAAAEMAPGDRLRMYTDIHSFSAEVFLPESNNTVLNGIQESILEDFSNFHATQPGNRNYPASVSFATAAGTTDEYFSSTYQIPAFTLELEPSFVTHGTDYNGFGRNQHDGFILPESEIRRVRDNMATAFTMMQYNMAGAPGVATARIYDEATGAILYNAEWDPIMPLEQSLYVEQLQTLSLDRDYVLWIGFDKPMRWRINDQAVLFPGVSANSNQDLNLFFLTDNGALTRTITEPQWLDQPGFALDAYRRYRDDSVQIPLRFDSDSNADLINQPTTVTLSLRARDMVGNRLDTNPQTVVDFSNGNWVNLEGGSGLPGQANDDRTLQFTLSNQSQPISFLVGQGQTAAWFDPDNNGEGFLIEMLSDDRAIMFWFTYDANGNQRWLYGDGQVRPNELYFPELLVFSGGQFGPGFDPNSVVNTTVGSAHFIFSDCDNASMRHNIDGRQLRQSVIRLTNPIDLSCQADGGSIATSSSVTGSWYDLTHAGEGFVVEQIGEDRVLIYWFTYDDQGEQAWIFGDGLVVGDEIIVDQALQLTGGRFGADFDPADVIRTPWGQMRFSFDCNTGQMSYQSLLANYGSGQQDLTRLTSVQGLSCDG